MPVMLLQTSDLKKNAGKILDAARRRPQFITRGGCLFQLALKEIPEEPRNLPVGYFNEPPDSKRMRVEKAFGRLKQTPDR